jgi:hypothetical protein
MDAKLVIIGGKASKGPISLKLPTTIGRSREAGLTVAHPMISRQHCELFEVDGLLRIRDLGSLNGTFVGQEKVAEADLYPQSQFTVGPLTFRVEYEYTGPVGDPAPADQPQAEAAEPAETIIPGGVPHFPATAVAPDDDEEAQPQPDPPPGFAPAATETPDFSAVGPDGAVGAGTEPQPESDDALQDAAEAPQRPTGQASQQTAAEPPVDAAPAANPAAAADKKGWWQFGKGKKPAVGKTSPAAKPAAGAAAPAGRAESPPPSGPEEMPDFLADAAAGAAERSKPADSEDDILGFLQ